MFTMIRVAVTGIGAVTPLGNTFRDTWEAAKAGKSGISEITRFNISDINIPWRVAGELKGFDPGNHLTRKEVLRLDRFTQYAVAAALMAAEDSGLSSSSISRHPSLDSAGIIIGSSRGGIGSIEEAVTGHRRTSAYLMSCSTVNAAPSSVSQKLGIRGYCLGISNACASGTNALGEAYRLIKTGFEGPVFAGAAEAPICRLCVEGYGTSGALSRRQDTSASRPFDRSRDGFVIAEGACVMVLENLAYAVKRGARLYGEIIGYANTADAFHPTRPDVEGEHRAIRAAISGAGIKAEDVDYINAHGTSTRIGDRIEAEAIEKVFGNRTASIAVSALKSMTGHMLAASGPLETACTLMSLREGIIPPTINISEKDEKCRLHVVTDKKARAIDIALCSSFGFGGVNAVLILKRPDMP
ncbi:MAG: beta-ketoacyl-ACP synthase II [Nitrospirae bacterium]|nr:beta-ketoacyl-ACP synthase II [Nitrospirota bacterium]